MQIPSLSNNLSPIENARILAEGNTQTTEEIFDKQMKLEAYPVKIRNHLVASIALVAFGILVAFSQSYLLGSVIAFTALFPYRTINVYKKGYSKLKYDQNGIELALKPIYQKMISLFGEAIKQREEKLMIEWNKGITISLGDDPNNVDELILEHFKKIAENFDNTENFKIKQDNTEINASFADLKKYALAISKLQPEGMKNISIFRDLLSVCALFDNKLKPVFEKKEFNQNETDTALIGGYQNFMEEGHRVFFYRNRSGEDDFDEGRMVTKLIECLPQT